MRVSDLHIIFATQDISLENVSSMYELSEAFNAMSLRHTCILFILQQFEKLSARPGYVISSINSFLVFLSRVIIYSFFTLYMQLSQTPSSDPTDIARDPQLLC